MSGLSKNIKSIRKTDLITQRNSVLGAKRVLMVHKATLNDTSIDLSSLNFPTAEYENTGVTNPSYAQILNLNLGVNSKNVEVVSSLNGRLMKMHYKVVSSSLINFINGYTVAQDEVFEISFEPSIIGGATLVDAQPLVQTHLLTSGNTDVVTDVFEYNKFPTKQVGAVMVFRQIDPSGPVTLMMRNVGNVSTGNGNYYEIAGADGVTNIIRFNNGGGANGDIVTVVSVGSLVERPTTSIMAFIERMNGDVDTLRETVAVLAGVPKSNFEDAPHTVDLATFGARVLALEDLYDAEIPIYEYLGVLTTTSTHTTNITYDNGGGLYWRDRDKLKARIAVSFLGAPNSSYTAFYLPASLGIEIDTAKVSLLTAKNGTLGSGHCETTGIYILKGSYLNTTGIQFPYQSAIGTFANLGTSQLSNGDRLVVEYEVPIKNWKTHKKLSELI